MVPPAHKVKPTMGLMSARLSLLVGEVLLPSPSTSEFTVTRSGCDFYRSIRDARLRVVCSIGCGNFGLIMGQ